MSDKICQNCGQLLATDDLVRFEGLGYYVALKSKNTFALKQPLLDVEYVRHKSCQAPKTGELDGD